MNEARPAPLLLPAALLVLGVLAAPWLSGPPVWWWVCGSGAIGAAVWCRDRRARLALAVLGWFALGLGRGATPQAALPSHDGERLWELSVRSVDARGEARVRLLQAAASPVASGPKMPPLDARLVGLGPEGRRTLSPGDRVLLRGRLREGFRGRDPVLRARRGAGGHPRRIGVDRGPGERVRAVPAALRRRVDRALLEGAPESVLPLFRALVLADRSGLSPELRESFSRTGTAHLLAISGLHVGTAAAALRGAILLPARRLAARFAVQWGMSGGPDRLVAAIAVLSAAAYVALAGAPVSARRALVMVAAGTFALSIGRRPSGWNALGAAAIALLWVDPAAARSLGFQLSFSAVAGLLAAGPTLERALRGRGRAGRALGAAAAASIITTLTTAPLCALAWGRVPIAGAWVNLVAVPLLGLMTLPPLLLGSLLGAMSPRLGEPWIRLAAAPAGWGLKFVTAAATPAWCPVLPWFPTVTTVAGLYAIWACVQLRKAEA